jgi:hypothetical protein
VACSEGCHQGLQLRRRGAPSDHAYHQYRSAVHGEAMRAPRAVLAVMTAARRRPGPSLRGRGPAAKSPDRAAGDRPNQASQQKQNAQLTRAWRRRMESQAATGRGPLARPARATPDSDPLGGGGR